MDNLWANQKNICQLLVHKNIRNYNILLIFVFFSLCVDDALMRPIKKFMIKFVLFEGYLLF